MKYKHGYNSSGFNLRRYFAAFADVHFMTVLLPYYQYNRLKL